MFSAINGHALANGAKEGLSEAEKDDLFDWIDQGSILATAPLPALTWDGAMLHRT